MVSLLWTMGSIGLIIFDNNSHQPSLYWTTRSGRRSIPENDAIHIHFHREGMFYALELEHCIFNPSKQEKQAEAIVEKLCQRFRLSMEPRQWRDIAYCLSLLPFKSERSVKKLIEGLPFYQDKLHEETVFNRFNEILVKVKIYLLASKGQAHTHIL